MSKADIGNRYGLYLDFLQRTGRLDSTQGAATLVRPDYVESFIAELQTRVRSVTIWNSIYKLRRAAELIAPGSHFEWLAEIENDIALVMVPRSKDGRHVLTERLVEAGLTLIQEAELFGKTPMERARGVRNGLLVTLLALHPIRIKNFAALCIEETLVNIETHWWLRIRSNDTKTNHVDQRQVPEFVNDVVNRYVNTHRLVLTKADPRPRDLWISSTSGRRLTTKNLGTLISRITRETIGVDVSPHLFRTAGASSAALHGGKYPHLATAVLNHRDPRVTEEHYNRATSLNASQILARIDQSYRMSEDNPHLGR